MNSCSFEISLSVSLPTAYSSRREGDKSFYSWASKLRLCRTFQLLAGLFQPGGVILQFAIIDQQ